MKILLGIIVVVILGVGYYALSPLFNVQEVNDELPESVTPTTQGQPSTGQPVQSGFEDLSDEDKEAMLEQMETANNTEQPIMTDTGPVEATSAPTVFSIMDTVGHPASGSVRVIDTAEGQVIRFEDFETINGPRLHLYLAKDLRATEFIDLGPIRGTRGNINYAVPDDVDLSEYRYVMHWCVPFGVLFNYADFASQ